MPIRAFQPCRLAAFSQIFLSSSRRHRACQSKFFDFFIENFDQVRSESKSLATFAQIFKTLPHLSKQKQGQQGQYFSAILFSKLVLPLFVVICLAVRNGNANKGTRTKLLGTANTAGDVSNTTRRHLTDLQRSWRLNNLSHCWTLLSICEHWWTLLSIGEHCWTLLSIGEHCWTLLNIVKHCRALLTNLSHCSMHRTELGTELPEEETSKLIIPCAHCANKKRKHQGIVFSG